MCKPLLKQQSVNLFKMSSLLTLRTVGMKYLDEVSVHEPKLIPEYMAGLLDGDGCIELVQMTSGRSSGKSGLIRVSLCQCDPVAIVLLCKMFGGTLEYKVQKGEKRTQYHWSMTGPKAIHLLNSVTPFLILKKHRAEIILDYWNTRIQGDITNQQAVAFFERMNEAQKTLRFEEEDRDRLTNAYLAGLFDAEGCVDVQTGSETRSESFCMTLTQRAKPEILHAIREKLGYGKVTVFGSFKAGTMEEMKKFIPLILPHSIIKHAQLDLAHGLVNIASAHRSYRDMERIKELKHTEYKFDEPLDQALRVHMEKVNDTYEKKDHVFLTVETRKAMSEKKLGTKKGSRTDEDKLKISQAVKKVLRNPLKEKHHKDILEDLKNNMPVTEIAKKYGLSRNYITSVKAGIHEAEGMTTKDAILTRRNDDLAKKLEELGYSEEGRGRVKTTLAMRKWTIPEFLCLKKYLRDHPEKKTCYKWLSDNSLTLFGKAFSLDTFKRLSNGKLKLFDFEVASLSEEEKQIAGEYITPF